MQNDKQQLEKAMNISEKRKQIVLLQKKLADPSIWQDWQKANDLNKKISVLQKQVDEFDTATTPAEIEKLKFYTLFSGEYDKNNAILTFSSGAGGIEAQDWTQMLLEMYRKFAKLHDFDFTLLEESLGQEAGIKSAVAIINGENAFGWLKSEAGVHRLVRLSPYDADKARHTSFALVEVIPEIEPSQVEEIPEKDLRVDVYHAQGHGGQGVNTTDSAVRITHLPTGLVATCQNERSQTQNKTQAMSILLSRFNSLKLKEHKDKIEDLRGAQLSPEWGSQIRSYVLHPYKMVKDHRTGHESKDPDAVLSGKINDFIIAYLTKA